MKLSLLYCMFVLTILSCSDNEYVDSIVENETSQGRFVRCLVDGDSLYLTEINGKLLFEGDIIVADFGMQTLSRGASLSLKSKIWPNNIVYYDFQYYMTDTTVRRLIKEAFKEWQDNSNVIFLPRNGQENFVRFDYGSSYSSHVGMKGGCQTLEIRKVDLVKGKIMHEIGHVLGLHHEHSRRDRNQYITIHFNNISEEGIYNFDMYSTNEGIEVGPFDFNSIMLYGSEAYSRNGLPTMTKKDGSTFVGQREYLSEDDIVGVAQRYRYIPIYGRDNWIPVPADYDGDGKADLSIKTFDGYWLIDYAANGYGKWDWIGAHRGGDTAHPVPADYDGDGKVDLAVKTDDGTWHIDFSNNGFDTGWDWVGYYRGGDTAHPVPADYDGDGKADLAVKTDDGTWYIDYSNNGFATGWDWIGYYRGGDTAHPVPADYDGDGKADLAVKTDDGTWHIDYSSNGFATGWDWVGYYRGGASAHPVPADYDGDGKADLAVKTDSGYWYIDYSSNGFATGWDWTGNYVGDTITCPVPVDYDGDGKADVAIKSNTGYWSIDFSSNGTGRWDKVY